MKEDEKFRLKMMEPVDAETLEWAQRASKEFDVCAQLSAALDLRMDMLRKRIQAHNSREELP